MIVVGFEPIFTWAMDAVDSAVTVAKEMTDSNCFAFISLVCFKKMELRCVPKEMVAACVNKHSETGPNGLIEVYKRKHEIHLEK